LHLEVQQEQPPPLRLERKLDVVFFIRPNPLRVESLHYFAKLEPVQQVSAR